ncbi:unnamed protein product [Diabrotica balteata]|uniref:Uncharacterized protein n=1 Tax=Diabrotica balteata TaxID=107213 RepID=A0A9N9TB23_DIABA|nr:unnamed protein product [Diabrotica balteata]
MTCWHLNMNMNPSYRKMESCLPPKPSQLPEVDETPVKPSLKLDAAFLGDIPGQYTICAVEPHQLPVVGVYIDPRVVPGFKYRIRPLPEVGRPSTINKCLFDNKALTLQSIGRGYARRFTFEADQNRLNNNENYFWSDNRPEGYAFELELLSEGDKFTFFNPNGEAEGIVEVLTIEVSPLSFIILITIIFFDILLCINPERFLSEPWTRRRRAVP